MLGQWIKSADNGYFHGANLHYDNNNGDDDYHVINDDAISSKKDNTCISTDIQNWIFFLTLIEMFQI